MAKKGWEDKKVTKKNTKETPKMKVKELEVPVHYHNKFVDENGKEYGELSHISSKEDSVAVDLYLSEDVVIEAGTFHLLKTNVSIELPKGYKADIKPRSSTFTKYGLLLASAPGLIDTSYNGVDDIWRMGVYKPIQKADMINFQLEVEKMKQTIRPMANTIRELKRRMSAKNTMFSSVKISAGTRLCQFEIFKTMPDTKFIDADLSNNEGRSSTNNKLEKKKKV